MTEKPFAQESGSPPTDPVLDPLNGPQREGATATEGPLLVVAGAGSGKTRLITHRIAHLIRSGVPPERILAITFTNKAASEMRERVERLLGVKSPWISTFHSFAARILRRNIYRIPPYTTAFTIYDEEDVRGIVREILRGMDLDPKLWSPRALASSISAAKNRGARDESDLPARSGYRDRILREVFGRYRKALEERNGVDFDDLLLLTVRLFEENGDVLERCREQFRYVLVDEYQDTNLIQYRIARLLTEVSRNLCVTGDPDQSIYSWRGADAENLKRFETDYPEARTIVLDQNYRSTCRILRVANAVIRHNPDRKPKDLWSEGAEGDPVRVRRFEDGADEAMAIAGEIRRLLDEGTRGGDIAVFYRINALSREFEQAFRYHVIPYVLVGGVEFYQRMEVKDLVAYLRILANPRDSESLRRIINVPARRIGPSTVAGAAELARSRNVPLLQAVLDPGIRGDLGGPSMRALEGFAELYGRLAALPKAPVAGLIEELIGLAGYEEHLRATKGEEAEDRLENVGELVNAAAEFDGSRPEGGLEGFLEEVALLSSVDRWERSEDRVSLMTLHSAKGLEFPAVFIVGLEQGLLPLLRSPADPEEEEKPNLSEERRLFYVGITRARGRLSISHTRERMRFGRLIPSMPSDFLGELVDEKSSPGLDLDAESLRCLRGSVEETGEGASRFIREEDGAEGDDGWDDGCDEDPFPKGARVRHETFGQGTVVRTWGLGRSRRITVRFDRAGEKQLVLGYAKIERIR